MRFINPRKCQCEVFEDRIPFNYTFVDGLITPEACRAVAEAFPPKSAPGWVHYDTRLEKKSVYNDRYGEPEIIQGLYSTLGDIGFLDLLEQITGLEGLAWDDSLHAAGLCLSTAGSKLDLHRDANVHPEMPWERALTAVLFLNDWQAEWGGNLELWSERDGLPFILEESIAPKCGRLVLFDPNGYHGFPKPLQCPEGVERKTVQVFYWRQRQARQADNARRRASFAPRPTDAPDPELDELRLARAM